MEQPKFMHRQMAKYVALVWIFLLASCAKDLTPQELIAKARGYVEAGDFEAANIELKNAAAKDPNNAEVRYELAGVALSLGDGPTAEKEARRAEALGMLSRDVILRVVEAIYLQGQFDRLLEESEKLPDKLQPAALADIRAYRAFAMLQKQQYRLADAEIAKALKLNENSVIGVLAKASYEAQVGRRETAVKLAERALEIDPKSTEAWTLLGDLRAADDDVAGAREAYDNAVANRHYVSLLQARRALIEAQLGDFDAANKDMEQLNEAGYKNHPYFNFVSGYIAFAQGNYLVASQALEVAVAGNPEDPVAKLYLVASYMADGKLEQAQMIANQLYFAIPNSVEIARMIASISIQQQDMDAARATLGKLMEQQDDDPMALGMLGTIALMEGKGDEAIDYLKRLTALQPDNESAQSMLRLAMTMRGDFVSEIVAASEQQVSEEEFDKVLVSAGAALQQGQLMQALAIAENLQQQFPQRVEPLNLLAAIYLMGGDWRRGKALLEQALAIDPTEPSVVKSLAKIYLRVNEEARAEQLLSAYLKENPRDQEAIGVQSELIIATRDFTEAEKQLTELLESDPENLEVQARLAKLYFDNRKYEQVALRTENLSEDDIKSQPSLMELRGKSLANMGNAEGAAKVWERWVGLSPDSTLANFYYAESLVNANEFARALEYLEIARELKPGYLPARLSIIRTAAQLGDLEKAFAEMKKLRSEMTEDRADVWYTQGWLNVKAGKFGPAVHALQKSLALQPTPETVMVLFTAMNSQGRTGEALAALEDWSEKFPESRSLMVALGQSYLAQKANDKAIAVYHRLLAVDPQSVLALNNLAWLTRETNPEQALEYANRGNKLAPTDPFMMSTLGTLLAENGKPAEGEQTLRKAVKLYPDNLQLKLDLGRLLLNSGKPDAAKPYLDAVAGSKGSDVLAAEAKDLLLSMNKGG